MNIILYIVTFIIFHGVIVTEIILVKKKLYYYMVIPGLVLSLPLLFYAFFTDYPILEYVLFLAINGIVAFIYTLIWGIIELVKQRKKRTDNTTNTV